MTDDELIGAYHEAMGDYEAARAGTGNRVETFAIGRTTARPSE